MVIVPSNWHELQHYKDRSPPWIKLHKKRECIANGIYQRGLSTVAIDLNESPGNLGNQLSDDSQRKFGVDQLETYIEKSKDHTPIYYLIDRFLADKTHKQDAALAQLAPMLQQLAPLMKQAGLI